MADVSWFENYLDRLAAVTVEDVQRVARTYFKPSLRNVGRYVPVGDGDTETEGHGDTETGGHGDTETGGHGDTETGGHGDTETGGHGDAETGGHGDMETENDDKESEHDEVE